MSVSVGVDGGGGLCGVSVSVGYRVGVGRGGLCVWLFAVIVVWGLTCTNTVYYPLCISYTSFL